MPTRTRWPTGTTAQSARNGCSGVCSLLHGAPARRPAASQHRPQCVGESLMPHSRRPTGHRAATRTVPLRKPSCASHTSLWPRATLAICLIGWSRRAPNKRALAGAPTNHDGAGTCAKSRLRRPPHHDDRRQVTLEEARSLCTHWAATAQVRGRPTTPVCMHSATAAVVPSKSADPCPRVSQPAANISTTVPKASPTKCSWRIVVSAAAEPAHQQHREARPQAEQAEASGGS